MATGKKTGGRQKGSLNKRTIALRKAIMELQPSGDDLMTFYLELLRNKAAPLDVRKKAASQLMPYMHPKLTSIEARAGGMGHEERLEMLRAMLADANAEPDDASCVGSGVTAQGSSRTT